MRSLTVVYYCRWFYSARGVIFNSRQRIRFKCRKLRILPLISHADASVHNGRLIPFLSVAKNGALLDRFEESASFLVKRGLAQERGMKNLCRKKIVFFAFDKEALIDLMHSLSQSNDCYEVRVNKSQRRGLWQADCLFTNESSLGDCWARYVQHPDWWCTVHDEEFTDTYKSNIRSY